MSCRKELFVNGSMKPYDGLAVNGYGGVSQRPESVGTVVVPCNVAGRRVNLFLHNVYYNPRAGCNLISTSQLKVAGATLAFVDDGISIQVHASIILARERHGLYFLDLW